MVFGSLLRTYSIVLGRKFMDTGQTSVPRAPRVSITARKEFTPEKRSQITGAYHTGAFMHDVVAC